jgi:hypothetical protein
MFPTNMMVSAARSVSADRARSLKVRFDNEDQLLARSLERPVFGWGRFGRSRVYDPATGKDISITDGHWLITLGQFGIFGFIAEFGLLAMAVFRASLALKFCESKTDKVLLSALSLIAAVNVLDLLPNSGLVPWTWLICGALLGRAEALASRQPTRVAINRSSQRMTSASQGKPSDSLARRG